jgi:sec-independent protein translocase protein TatB
MLNLGIDKILVILLVALVVVGPHRLPELSRKLGKVLRELQRLSAGAQEQIRGVLPVDELKAALPLSDLHGMTADAVTTDNSHQVGHDESKARVAPSVDLGPPSSEKPEGAAEEKAGPSVDPGPPA